MSTTPNILMLAPDGSLGYVPPQNVESAVAAGGKVGVRMTSPDGTKGVIPFDQQDTAQKNGATWDVSPDNDATKNYMTWRQQAIANRPTDLLGQPANVPLTPPANLGSGPTISGQSDASTKLNSIPFAKKLFDAVEALDDAANFTQEGKAQHPIQAELSQVADRLKGFLFGGAANSENNIGTGQYGIATNPVLAAITPADAEATPAAAKVIESGVNALKSGASAVKDAVTGASEGAAAETPNFTTRVAKGEEVAQPPAQAALRTGAQEASADESTANNIAANPSLRTSLEEPIDAAQTSAKQLYRQIDAAAGTDFKALNDKLSNTNYQIRQLTDTEEDVAKEAALEKSRQGLIDKIQAAKQQAIDNGVDPETLDNADAQFTKSEALQDVEAKVFKNPSVVQGNAQFGTPETVNVDKAIVQLQKLQDKTEFGGSRLEQALGQQGAQNLLANLYKAQRVGKQAVKTQQIAKWAGITLAGGGVVGGVIKGAGALADALSGAGKP